jgi:potassium-dependent mechanosensitive channel
MTPPWYLRFLALCLLALPLPATAQLPGLPKAPPPESPAAETSEQTEKRLQQWLKDARLATSQLNDPGVKLPEGIDPGAVADYRRDLEQIILGVGRQQKTLAAMPEARKALDAAQAEEAEWDGFPQPPPYSILMIDELFNQLSAVKSKAASYRSSHNLFGQTLSNIHAEAKAAEETSRRLVAAAANDREANSAAKWRLAADKTKSRALALRSTLFQSNIALVEIQSETANSQIALLERQIATAERDFSFGDEEIDKVSKAAAERRAALRKEITAVRKRQQEASAERSKLQADLDRLLNAKPEGTDTEQAAEIDLARLKLEACETRVEASQYIIETLESIDLLESYLPDSYANRRILKTSDDKAAINVALLALKTTYDRIRSWSTVASNNLSAVNADISKQESRAALLGVEDPLLVAINDQRSALWDKQAVTQRLTQTVASQRRMLRRWLAEFELAQPEKDLTETLADASTTAWGALRRIWEFEVFQYTDTVMISGIPSTEKRAVPLGKFFIATLFFMMAYLTTASIKNRVQTVVVRRGHIAEAQAKTLSNWLMIVVGILLALATLHYLRIPLTVFAFFGGALAIGLGFGSQTLIKNFICGIIVLFERKIRVGDVVDVGGIAGSITEINTRSSVLSGPDGRETLVPNSVFLETSVTNLTLANRVLRRFITVGVAYGTPPGKVIEILTECTQRHGRIRKEPTPIAMLSDFADSAMLYKLYFWISLDGKTTGEVVESDLRIMIEKSFAEAGIEFPFPQRDIRLTMDHPLVVTTTSEPN